MKVLWWQHLSPALLLSRCSAPSYETGNAGWRSGPVPPPGAVGACLWAPVPSSEEAVGSTVWLVLWRGFNEISSLYTQQALNSVPSMGPKLAEQEHSYAIFIVGSHRLMFPRPQNRSVPSTGPRASLPPPWAGFLCSRAVFAPRDSAALWRKNQIPNWTPFIGGWVASPPRLR